MSDLASIEVIVTGPEVVTVDIPATEVVYVEVGETPQVNALALDNETAWGPTGDFNPATKYYVDYLINDTCVKFDEDYGGVYRIASVTMAEYAAIEPFPNGGTLYIIKPDAT